MLVHGDRALCEVYGEIRSRPTLYRTKYDFSCNATFLVKLVSVAGEWKIVSFECIYNNDDIATLANLGERGFDMKVKRESYKCLAYVVEKTQGHKLDENLPRWDRPKEAMQVLDEARKWIIG